MNTLKRPQPQELGAKCKHREVDVVTLRVVEVFIVFR